MSLSALSTTATAAAPTSPQIDMEQLISTAMESCVARAALGCAAGGAMGVAFGMFTSSMEFSNNEAYRDLKFKQQLKHVGGEMGKRAYTMSKQFAYMSTIFAFSECAIEGYRAKHDTYNPIAAGCVTGGILAIAGGPQSALLGCAGFAAFSAAIDKIM